MKRQENVMIYANAQRCLGCHSCEMACAVSHGGDSGLFDAVKQQLPLHPRMKVVVAGDVNLPMQCRQCDNAPCALVCPTGACRQSNGQVQINEANCVGCKLCVMVCPFGSITVRRSEQQKGYSVTNQGVAQKCDLCVTWREAQGKTQTACIEACPTKAISLVDMQTYRQALIQARAKELAHSQKNIDLALRGR
ncbi:MULTISPECIES: 4Fe-4S dicluster domain-containing protein [unclassified Symbiopectobacterium]|uniref:4Fe-4S dicluster domain-containing protein n=1 Tax=unclassified Symbiopectobacterium TaxID=2794573 RepID=UPI002227E0C0|nr:MULTISPECIES: 4Fe-4S dicluster domain-containing protein [unclassified Symbiopectobacterium]